MCLAVSNMADNLTENVRETLKQTALEKPKYQGIMAFKTVENLVKLSDEKYVPPKFPFELPTFDGSSASFGVEMRKHFLLDLDNWTFLNHGAFGCVLKDALETAYKWQCYVERQPVRFVDREMLPLLAHVNRRLAKFVGAETSDIVLLPNATAAINTVIKSTDWHSGDIVYFLNTCYYTVKKLFRHVSSEYGKQIETSYPGCVLVGLMAWGRKLTNKLTNQPAGQPTSQTTDWLTDRPTIQGASLCTSWRGEK